MEMLRTKSPEMVRKEVAMHLLAYNLIRGIMAEAARAGEVKPRRLSFTGAVHTVRSFEEVASVRPGADRGGPAAAAGVDRREAGGGSPGPVRAACGEAAAEAAPAAADAAEGGEGG